MQFVAIINEQAVNPLRITQFRDRFDRFRQFSHRGDAQGRLRIDVKGRERNESKVYSSRGS